MSPLLGCPQTQSFEYALWCQIFTPQGRNEFWNETKLIQNCKSNELSWYAVNQKWFLTNKMKCPKKETHHYASGLCFLSISLILKIPYFHTKLISPYGFRDTMNTIGDKNHMLICHWCFLGS